MKLEQAKAKAKARLAWVGEHPDYLGEGDKVVKVLLAEVERLALIEAKALIFEGALQVMAKSHPYRATCIDLAETALAEAAEAVRS